MYFIGKNGYYEGDKIDFEDIEVEQRPNSDYQYINNEWIYVPPEPKTSYQLLAETDQWMSRISEDTVVALINKGVALKSDYAPIVIDRINYRRSLRGQPPI